MIKRLLITLSIAAFFTGCSKCTGPKAPQEENTPMEQSESQDAGTMDQMDDPSDSGDYNMDEQGDMEPMDEPMDSAEDEPMGDEEEMADPSDATDDGSEENY